MTSTPLAAGRRSSVGCALNWLRLLRSTTRCHSCSACSMSLAVASVTSARTFSMVAAELAEAGRLRETLHKFCVHSLID
jgi:hypothetical protein